MRYMMMENIVVPITGDSDMVQKFRKSVFTAMEIKVYCKDA